MSEDDVVIEDKYWGTKGSDLVEDSMSLLNMSLMTSTLSHEMVRYQLTTRSGWFPWVFTICQATAKVINER